MDLSWYTFGLSLAVVFVGAFAQATAGFGLALVVVPVLGQVNPDWVPGPILWVTFLLSAVIVWRDGRSIDRRTLVVPMLGQILGILLALMILGRVTPRVISILTGSIVLFAVVLSAFGFRVHPKPPHFVVAGTLAGFMGTTASIPGPPLALLHQDASPARLRATMAHFFVVGNGLALLGLAWTGRFGMDEMIAGLTVFPAAGLGYGAASLTADRLSASWIRRLILLFSAAGALILIYRAS